jgi:hypothetical protein
MRAMRGVLLSYRMFCIEQSTKLVLGSPHLERHRVVCTGCRKSCKCASDPRSLMTGNQLPTISQP